MQEPTNTAAKGPTASGAGTLGGAAHQVEEKTLLQVLREKRSALETRLDVLNVAIKELTEHPELELTIKLLERVSRHYY